MLLTIKQTIRQTIKHSNKQTVNSWNLLTFIYFYSHRRRMEIELDSIDKKFIGNELVIEHKNPKNISNSPHKFVSYHAYIHIFTPFISLHSNRQRWRYTWSCVLCVRNLFLKISSCEYIPVWHRCIVVMLVTVVGVKSVNLDSMRNVCRWILCVLLELLRMSELFVSSPVCLSVCLSVCLFVCLFIYV